VAERIQRAVSAPVRIGDQEIFTTASIGILMGSPEYASATDMIRDADTAMYHAKMAGKAQAVLFDPMMHAMAMSRLQLESDLRWALERDELRVHYQPIIELETGNIVGLEALVRWQHPQHGLLLPSEFLHIAEESGLLSAMGWWTLRVACTQLAAWRRELPSAASIWISVNLSAKQLAKPDLVERVSAVLRESELPPACLKLEITEHMLVESSDTTLRGLTELRQAGVQVCIDDFGTGYSSLSYLQRFPVDVLKIDRSFISEIGLHGRHSKIVQTILGLARTLGMQAVAEGTETPQQADELRRLSCDFGQGWLFSKALDAADVGALIMQEGPLGGIVTTHSETRPEVSIAQPPQE
jgi:EAL domain-containing protein (putative c-di-GMP-specific phosphodiesterase class I)